MKSIVITGASSGIGKASAPSRIINVSSVAHAGMTGIYGEIDGSLGIQGIHPYRGMK